jgi:DNA-binding transcriptional LysR family regulator
MNVQVGFDLRLVPTAVAVAEDLNFGTAARRLGLAPSAVSHHIARLESQLGVTLFDRSTRRVALTDAGAAFVQHARSIVRAAHRATLEANQAANKRELRIAIDIDIPDRLIRHLRRFGSSSGDISLRVLPMQQSDALDRVVRGTVDHCVIWSNAPASFDGDTDELLPVGIWCVVPADSPLAAGRSVPVEDLRGERLVIYRPDATTQSFYDEFLDALAVIDPVVEHVEGDDVQFEMCREITTGGGFTITSEADTAHLPSNVVALPFWPPIATRLVLCSPGEVDHTLRRRILQHFRSTPLRPRT